MKKDIDLLFDLLRADGSIVVNKKLAKGVGLHQAIMYSELISKYLYFSKRGELKEGYFFNTVENMEQDTCLSDYQQREAIAKLKDLGLIDYKVKGIPPKRYFKIIVSEKVSKILNALFSKDKALRIDSQKTEELILKKLDGNNTNLNNTKNNHNNPDASTEKKLYLNEVYLTDEEYQKLINEYSKKKTEDYIEFLNRYIVEYIIPGKRRPYQSHYLTIKAWIQKDKKRELEDDEPDRPDARKELKNL